MRSNPGSADYVEGFILDTKKRARRRSLVKEQALQDKIEH